MSLIEQLGGYEKLKPHFITTDSALGYTHVYLHGNSHYCFLDDSVDYIVPDRAILIKDVLKALLEHRRQYNIFEVGDKVLFINDVYADYDNVVSIDFIGKFDLMVSDHTKGFQLNEFCGWSKVIRHANDEEIKAGKRLELGK